MKKMSFIMYRPKRSAISINGAIYDVNISHDEFLDEFVDWVESKGWAFMGMTNTVTEDEAQDSLIDLFQEEKDREKEKE